MKRELLLSMLFTCLVWVSYAQSKVTGKVTSAEDGSGIPGASVQIKGTTKGTQTDMEGNYAIDVASNQTLVFSFVGMDAQEILVGNKSVINVVLVTDPRTLSEVVVTALGRVKEEKAVGTAMQTVKSDKLTFAKETNVASALSGKIAGVKLQGAPSTSFREPNLLIRGATGLSIYASPLYVLDGTPVDLSAVNMDNIESISVLKGAAATAIYGQRAADGVIVLNSKKSKKGRMQVDINSATTFSSVYNLPPYQNEYAGGYSQDWTTFEFNPAIHPSDWASFNGQKMLEYYADESWGPKMDGTPYRPYYSWFTSHPGFGKEVPLNPQPDNVKNFYQTGVDLNNNVTIGGGSDNATYRLSYTNIDRTLPIPNTQLKRNFITLNTTFNLSKKLTAGANINYLVEAQRGRPLEGYGQGLAGSFNQWFQRQVDMDILSSYKNPDGTFNSWNINGPENTRPLYWDNPYYDVYENVYNSSRDRVYGDINLKYQFNTKFSIQGWIRNNSRYVNDNFRVTTGGLNQDGFFASDDRFTEWNYEFLADYRERIGDLTLDLSVGGNLRNEERLFSSMSTNGGLSIPNFYNISASKDRPAVTYRTTQRQVRSVYGLASLGYKGFLYLDATIRNDWSSTLPVNANSYLYPSIATSFVFSEFMKNQPILSFGKIKASWATVGSDTNPYQIYPVYSASAAGSLPIMSLPSQLPNTSLKPTLSKSYDLGTEIKFLKDRIGFDFTYYSRENINQILPLSVPSTSGFNTALVNAGNITNYGLELAATFIPVRKKNFEWEVNFNIARARTIVKELAEGLTNYQLPTFAAYGIGTSVSGSSTAFGPTVNARVGEAFGLLVGRGFRRFQAKDAQGNAIDNPNNGRPIVNANGTYAFDNNVVLGSILPDYTGGLVNTMKYKNLVANFNIDFQKGGKVYSVSRMFNAYSGLGIETVGVNENGVEQRNSVASGGGLKADGVLVDGSENTKFIEASDYWKSLFRLHERWLYDASYAKLREVSLGYQVPTSVFENRLPIRSIYVGAVGRNVFILRQPVKGLDPSELESVWSEGGQLPAARSWGFNIKLGI